MNETPHAERPWKWGHGHLFRWYRHWHYEFLVNGWWCIVGFTWRNEYGRRGPCLYISPDATPTHPKARGLGARRD